MKAGTPRSDADGQALDRFHARIQIPIVLAALLPLVLVPESGGWVAEVVGVIAWAVFVVDFVVSERRLTRYLGTWLGRFDLTVVVLTAPWYLLPGTHEGRFVVILRLARLARVVMASRGARRLMERLGRVGLVALGVLVISSAVAYHAEHATNFEFATYGDSLVGNRDHDHGRLRRHRSQDLSWPLGRRHDHAHRCCRHRSARRFIGQLLPVGTG